ncbi:MAG: thiamine pyrophosphate-dependent enzyme [Ignavibacteria bacterium]|jgi:indolepyruvate ferredoxin oxidoreductase alpha subunit
MEKLLLLGDEAVAQGALDAGMSGMYAYPGTPSTEIMEYVQLSKLAKERNIHRAWSANEKTAMEASLGMSYAGKRSVVAMKHVGLNVAADVFMNSAITGVNGGLIVAVADDPSMHSSQNEQDSRYYGRFALVPILEPSNQQEAYDMAYDGMELSEKYNLPVLVRLTTRLSHSRSGVKQKTLQDENKMSYPSDPIQFVLLPSNARKKYNVLLEKLMEMRRTSDDSKYNNYIDGNDKSLGIIACGIGYNYLLENFSDSECPHPILKIGQYPLPTNMVKRIDTECKEILVIEEGYPMVEELLRGFLNKEMRVHGRLDGTIPRAGELNPNIIATALGKGNGKTLQVPELVANRPPQLCSGCSHVDVYEALNETMKQFSPDQRVFSDIGCYTLGALAPYKSIHTCVDMGASVTMAKGAADAGVRPAIAVIGDSTFTHSGITGLLDAVNENTPITVIISDNSTTAMTGGQQSSAYAKLEDICIGVGVHPDHVRVVTPHRKYHQDVVDVLKEEIAYEGVSVVIPRRECIQTATKSKKEKKIKTEEVSQ